MPIATKCPGCKALFRLADDLAGKKVRCQKCAQLFAVPRPKSAAPAVPPAPVPTPAAPAPVPPISMSLDDPPLATTATGTPAPPAQDKILDAILVDEPKPAVVIEATLVEPPIVIAAASADEAPAAPPNGRRKSNDDDASDRPTPARRRRSGDLPRHSSVGSGFIAFGVFLLLAALIVGAFVGTWALLNMGKGNKIAVMPPQPKAFDKGAPEVFFQQLPLDADGKATVAGNVPANTTSVYRVFLQQNQRYHLLVVGEGFLPQVQVRDDSLVTAAREGDNRNLLSFEPLQTGEHTIRVSHPAQFQPGKFTLSFARADKAPPTQINLAGNGNFKTERTLRLEDPVNEEFHHGPCHKYLLNVKSGEKYHFKIKPTDFKLVLRLQNGGIFLDQRQVDAVRAFDYTYTVPQPVTVLSIHVSSDMNALGKYTLEVTRLTDEGKPGPRNVAFDFGAVYHRDEMLAVQDPRDGALGHVKTYLIPMEKGLGYNIDMKSQAIDAHLSLFDPQGELVAKDDDSGGDFNARMLFDPKTSGQYRLLASDVKKGTGAFTIDIGRISLPKTELLARPLPTVKRQEAGCDIVQADSGSFVAPSSFAWAPEGKAFFVADRFGTLRRFRYPDMTEEQRLVTAPAHVHLTAEGLLASVQGSAEMWLVDPQNLRLKRRLPRVGANVLASPSLSHIYVTATFNKAGGGQAPGLIRHDLTNAETQSFPFLKSALNTQFLAITADGRHLLGSDDNNFMVRWRVQDQKIIKEETGTRIFRGWPPTNPGLVISADGKLLLHPINNRFLPQDEIKPAPASDYGVAAYRVNDFKEPVFVLDTGIPFSAAAIDPKSGLICMHTKTRGLVLADAQGKIVRELAISTMSAGGATLNRPITRWRFIPTAASCLRSSISP